ncbi:ShlB/FhaC/HecB family hemolysin secretion/activation protein [Achromobacter pestifer]|uniref:ShlB/FhaC/HecB family hemolysin secretion/activation protein n=1 Tax=Achromobacter pestifer TaxID=1353889 RepID=A0A7D4E0W2_9BURK|nr:ShlB/FhaC/HecB family hemolysin secretion/activation protein [Achromobacter pestifer]QKH36229.1 ShlB/FhaC/HecB family hemolysin secretion/activation protein [Achromobacter pestifer]
MKGGRSGTPGQAGARLRRKHSNAGRKVAVMRAGLAMALCAGTSWAQIPDAGRAFRDLESALPAMPSTTRAPDVELPEPQPPARASGDETAGPSVLVREFRFEGNHAVDGATLQALLADLAGSELMLPGLRAAADRITAYYHDQGYVLARAYLPPQDIDAGVLRITVLEGSYGEIDLKNRSRVRDAVLEQPLSTLRSGDAVQARELEQALLLLSDLPGVVVKGTLRPGAETGTTSLLVDAQPGPLIFGSVDADNFGGYYTGEYRLSGSIGINSPLGLGDQLHLRLLSSDRDQRYYNLAYQLPLGPWSTRVGVGASRMRYGLGKRFEPLGAHGRADVSTVFIQQPLVRSRSASLRLQLQHERKRLADSMDLFDLTSRKRVGLWTVALTGSNADGWFGGGQSALHLSHSRGRLRLGDAQAEREDRQTVRAGGWFARTNLSASRLQNLAGRLQLFARLDAQWASRNLDSSEKFSLGGPYGVRAYPLGAASGDEGWLASAELRYQLAPGWQLSAFADRGGVRINKRRWTREDNGVDLGAAGIGITQFGSNHQVSLSVAWPMGRQLLATQADQEPRFWLQASRYF